MNTPTNILYPRHKATIRVVESEREPIVARRLDEIEASDLFKEHKRLVDELTEARRSNPVFTCWKCSAEYPIKDLILYDFRFQNDGPDEWQYHDYNVVCPRCGRFSHLDGVKYGDYSFKEIKEIWER